MLVTGRGHAVHTIRTCTPGDQRGLLIGYVLDTACHAPGVLSISCRQVVVPATICIADAGCRLCRHEEIRSYPEVVAIPSSFCSSNCRRSGLIDESSYPGETPFIAQVDDEVRIVAQLRIAVGALEIIDRIPGENLGLPFGGDRCRIEPDDIAKAECAIDPCVEIPTDRRLLTDVDERRIDVTDQVEPKVVSYAYARDAGKTGWPAPPRRCST